MCLCYVEFNSLLQGFTVFALFTDNWLADFDSTFIAVEGISGVCNALSIDCVTG
jgi:hypothetical protein